MRQPWLSLAFVIASAACVAVGVRKLLNPRRARADALRGLQPERLWWPWSAFAKRFDSEGYLWEIRIVAVVSILMGVFFAVWAALIATGRTSP